MQSFKDVGSILFPSSAIVFTDVLLGYGVAADLALALFPITILWNLQLPRTTKLGLAGIMSLGVL